MSDERIDMVETPSLDLLVDLITSDAKHVEAWNIFSALTVAEIIAAKSQGEMADFLRNVAFDRRRFLFEWQSPLVKSYHEIEAAFNNLGVEILDSGEFLAKIRQNAKVKRMNDLRLGSVGTSNKK